jgi:hypothetical protein
VSRIAEVRALRRSWTWYDPASMFDQEFGSGATRWLKWFMGVAGVYAFVTLLPESPITVGLAGILCAAILGIMRYQIAKGKRGD